MFNFLHEMNDQKLTNSNPLSKDDLSFGRWSDEEHEKFIQGKFLIT